MKKLTIIIPIFNESESIFKLIDEIKYEFRNNIPQILIVDDGSDDDFHTKVKNKFKNIIIVYHQKISENVKQCILVFKSHLTN